ncbi:hypothetical protein [Adonisia turfae]|uniref:hypothetical protein n=1 Tax=Adonisia turfae TaxID=2950184 RepID=UPI0020299879|nr:hypothetical protein [Adonisia turfae]
MAENTPFFEARSPYGSRTVSTTRIRTKHRYQTYINVLEPMGWTAGSILPRAIAPSFA